MAQKGMLVDTSKCIGCKGCQVQCKMWNELEAVTTRQTGSYQNPPDLTYLDFNVVRFDEIEISGQVQWLLRSDRCRHCAVPGCFVYCPVPDVIHKDPDTGAVYYKNQNCGPCNRECAAGCPWNIPKFEGNINRAWKCHLCFGFARDTAADGTPLPDPNQDNQNRINKGKIPACANACPVGAITYYDNISARDKAACDRLGVLLDPSTRDYYPRANLFPSGDYNVKWILTEDPDSFSWGEGVVQAQPDKKKGVMYALKELMHPLMPVALVGGLFYAAKDAVKADKKE